jgi:hypothetical protein
LNGDLMKQEKDEKKSGKEKDWQAEDIAIYKGM